MGSSEREQRVDRSRRVSGERDTRVYRPAETCYNVKRGQHPDEYVPDRRVQYSGGRTSMGTDKYSGSIQRTDVHVRGCTSPIRKENTTYPVNGKKRDSELRKVSKVGAGSHRSESSAFGVFPLWRRRTGMFLRSNRGGPPDPACWLCQSNRTNANTSL